MSVPALHIRRLDVQRMPGIPLPGFTLKALADGVNVIHGRNGSGKTTTANAIEILLCPAVDEKRQATAAGSFALGDDTYQITVQAGHADCLRNGEPVPTPELGPRENRSRYRLALHDLIRTDDHDFAGAVLAASHGGLNLADTAERLGYRPNTSGTRSFRLEVDAACQHCRTATQKQQEVEAQERELATLEEQRREFEPARQRIELLKTAEALVAAREGLASVEARLRTYDERIARLTGREKETIDNCARRRADIEKAIHEAAGTLEAARTRLQRAGLPPEGLTLGTIEEWRSRCGGLREIEQAIEGHKAAVDSAHRKMAAVRGLIPGDISDEQLAKFGPAREDELTEFARQAEEAHGRKEALRRLGEWLGQPQEHAAPERLRDAIRILARWMGSPSAGAAIERGGYLPAIVSGAIIGVLALVLAFVSHWAWIFASVLAAIPWLIQALTWWKASNAVDHRAVHRDEFLRTGMEEPRAWTEDAVAEAIDGLEQRLAAASLERERAEKRKALDSERQDLDQACAQLEQQQRDIEARIGIRPGGDDVWLHAIVNSISRWQAAYAEARSATAKMEAAVRECGEKREALHRELAAYDAGAIGDSYALGRRVQEINARREAFASAQQDIGSATQLKAQAEGERNRLQDEHEHVFAAVGIAPADERTLLTWLEQKPSYDALSREALAAKGRVLDAERSVADQPELATWPLEQIRHEREQIEARLTAAKDVPTRIGEIQHTIKVAKEGHDLTDALAAHEDALAKMRQKRDEEGRAVVGHLLAEFVTRKAAEDRPAVFNEARKLLGRITGERLRLEFNERNGGSFRAHDNVASRFKTLDELSSGERLQVLLAVRLAFVEQQEQELSGRLPLMIDEALANSDDERADAIIDAVIEIARTGRQVFYFTAQLDEVAKWQRRLEQTGVSYRVLDLDEIRGLARVEAHPLPAAAPPSPPIPSPTGLGREEYAKVLRVPGIDPWAPDARATHLWHLIEDVNVLYGLLCNRIETWGQYEQLALHGGIKSEPDRRIYERAAARARVIETALQAWQIGRARPIDRSHLDGADGISPNMLDRADQLLSEVGGDAKTLIQALRDGRLPRWRDSNTDRLEDYLIGRGHIAVDAPLAIDQINARILAACRQHNEAHLVDQQFVDGVLVALTHLTVPRLS